jgi:hypothetical protein
MISILSDKSTENAKLRLSLWRERSAELLRDTELFLPVSEENSEDSAGVPTYLLTPSESQRTQKGTNHE